MTSACFTFALEGSDSSTAPSRLLAITWIGYLGGAMAGTALLAVMPWPLLVPAALLVIVAATL